MESTSNHKLVANSNIADREVAGGLGASTAGSDQLNSNRKWLINELAALYLLNDTRGS